MSDERQDPMPEFRPGDEPETHSDGAAEAQPDAAAENPVPERLSYTSPPALMTAVVLSMVLLAFAMFGWWQLGPEIRSEITWPRIG